MSDEADARARLGAVLNEKWTLEKLLGVGGMGAVYAARHRNGARAAVKVLHAELARHADLRDRFLREGYAANRVEHPGAVKVIDDDLVTSGPDEGTAYLVMEMLVGESLQDRGERLPPVTELEFLGVASSVLDVLAAAHARGVVHRDLKPENVFLARDEETGETRVKVLDFGLARLLDAHTTTMQGVALGTPSYMSPEQASGRHDEIDGRTDLFSLAATGFRLVAGRRIHDGEGPVELVTKMANLPAPRMKDVAPHVSAPFARVIDRALSFRREDRHPDAAAMREDVRRAMAELGADAPVDSRAFAEAKTVVAVPAAGLVAAAAPPTATIELSARDLRPLDAPTLVAPVEDLRPTAPEVRPPVSAKPAAPARPAVPPPPAPPPPTAPPPPAPRKEPPALAAPKEEPKKKGTSFVPTVIVVVLVSVALKLTLDTQPAPSDIAARDAATDVGGDASAATDAAMAPDALAPAPLVDEAPDAATGADDADARDEDDAGADARDTGERDAASDATPDDDARAGGPRSLSPEPAGPLPHPASHPAATPAAPKPMPRPPAPKPHGGPRRRGAR